MATQTPIPQEGDRSERPQPDAPGQQPEPGKPDRPIFDHPEEQNSG